MTGNERLTLVISTFALIASGLSLWDSHENSNLRRAETVPHLVILSADFTQPKAADPRFLVAIFRVINEGEIGVTITKADIHPTLSALPGEAALRPCYEELGKQDFTTDDPQLQEKLGGKGKSGPGIITAVIQLPPNCPETGWTFLGKVDFEGRDDSGHRYDSRDYSDLHFFKAALPRNKPRILSMLELHWRALDKLMAMSLPS